MTDEERDTLKDAFFLTDKKVIYVANVNESQLPTIDTDPNVQKVREYAKAEGAEVIALCAKLEEELSELDDEDKEMMMQDYGIDEFCQQRDFERNWWLTIVTFLVQFVDDGSYKNISSLDHICFMDNDSCYDSISHMSCIRRYINVYSSH